jgi:hypothetical protein
MRWPRRSALLLAVLVLAAGCGSTASAPREAPELDAAWERLSSMSQRRSYLAAAQVGPWLYAAGGMVGETGRPLATFARYDTRTDAWEVLSRLPDATRAAAAAAVGGTLYVIGGTTPKGNTRAVWAWRGTWHRVAPLPVARFNHAAVALGGRIYVLGGYEAGREHAEVFAYDPVADRWSRAGTLPRPLHAFGALAVGGEIWTIGGRVGEEILRDVWILNPGTGRWRRGPAMPKPMELLGTALAGNEVHAVWESTYQVYDRATRTWRDGPTPGVTRHALRAFAADGWLYTLGGCTTALRDSPVVERIALRG